MRPNCDSTCGGTKDSSAQSHPPLALEVRTPHWDLAFEALDKAGIVAALHGRNLRVLGADRDVSHSCCAPHTSKPSSLRCRQRSKKRSSKSPLAPTADAEATRTAH